MRRANDPSSVTRVSSISNGFDQKVGGSVIRSDLFTQLSHFVMSPARCAHNRNNVVRMTVRKDRAHVVLVIRVFGSAVFSKQRSARRQPFSPSLQLSVGPSSTPWRIVAPPGTGNSVRILPRASCAAHRGQLRAGIGPRGCTQPPPSESLVQCGSRGHSSHRGMGGCWEVNSGSYTSSMSCFMSACACPLCGHAQGHGWTYSRS